MSLINFFYTARFLFYLILPESYHLYSDAGTFFLQTDIFLSSVAGVIIAGTLAASNISEQRAKKFLLIPPLILFLPGFLIPILSLINRQFEEVFESLISLGDIFFLIYSVSFALLLPYLIMIRFNTKKQVYFYSFGILFVGLINLVFLKQNNFLFNLAHNIPFIVAGFVINKKNRTVK